MNGTPALSHFRRERVRRCSRVRRAEAFIRAHADTPLTIVMRCLVCRNGRIRKVQLRVAALGLSLRQARELGC